MKTKLKCACLLLMLVFAANEGFAQKSKTDSKSKKTGVTASYDAAGPFCNGLARVKKNNKWGYIDTTGNVVVSPRYNQVENFSDGLARVRLGQKWGLIDTTGHEIIKPTFDWIYDFVDGKAEVKIDGVKYYMNKQGQRVE